MKIEDYQKKIKQDPEYIAAEKELRPFFILANNVLRLRMEMGWTQSELARRLGTRQANISRIENGVSNPTLKFLQKLAEVVDTNIENLFQAEVAVIKQVPLIYEIGHHTQDKNINASKAQGEIIFGNLLSDTNFAHTNLGRFHL